MPCIKCPLTTCWNNEFGECKKDGEVEFSAVELDTMCDNCEYCPNADLVCDSYVSRNL